MKSVHGLKTYVLVFFTLIGIIYVSEFSGWFRKSRSRNQTMSISAGSKMNNLSKAKLDQGADNQCVSDNDRFSQVKYFVLFIGYARSGSTLLGSLLDAHPNVIIANEYGLAGKLKTFTAKQKSKSYIFNRLYKNSQWEATQSQRSSTFRGLFNYFIPNQWQGKYNCSIQIIGDKKAVQSIRKFSWTGDRLLNQLRRIIGVPIRFVHIYRNPFDNVATMVLQHTDSRNQAASSDFKPLDNELELRRCITRYLNWVKRLEAIRSKYPDDVIDVEYTEMVKRPRQTAMRLCEFLKIDCSQQYVKSFVKKTFRKETYTRRKIIWTEELKWKLISKMEQLAPYRKFAFEVL